MVKAKRFCQAAASMMSPPMSPAKKNAKDPDKPKVLYGPCTLDQPSPVAQKYSVCVFVFLCVYVCAFLCVCVQDREHAMCKTDIRFDDLSNIKTEFEFGANLSSTELC